MSIMDELKHPAILIGGVGLGLVFLMLKSSGGASSNGGNDAAVASYNSVAGAYNLAALNAQTAQMGIVADVQKAIVSGKTQIAVTDSAGNIQAQVAKTGGDVSRYIATTQYLENMNNNASQQAMAQMTSQAGVANNIITTNGAVSIDAAQQNVRLALGVVQSGVDINNTNKTTAAQQAVAATQANAAVQAAQIQAKAAQHASDNSLWGNIFGTIGKVATAFI